MPSLRPVLGELVLDIAQRGAGAYPTGPISNPGYANTILVLVYVSGVTGTTYTLDAAIQTSPDASTWTTVQSMTQMTGVGQSVLTACIDTAEYGQVLATVGGTGSPTVTFSLAVMVI